jgi:hypothetical protein
MIPLQVIELDKEYPVPELRNDEFHPNDLTPWF